MFRAKFLRVATFFLLAAIALAACSSDEDLESTQDAEAAEAEVSADSENSTDSEDSTVSTDATTSTSDESSTEPAALPDQVDDRTPEEVAIDELDVMIFQLGIQNIEEAADCVIDRLESEGVELVGQGTAELIALTRCEPSVISEWLPESNPLLPANRWSCVVEGIGSFLNEQTIAEAEAFLGATTPSDDLVERLSDRCETPPEDIFAALSS